MNSFPSENALKLLLLYTLECPLETERGISIALISGQVSPYNLSLVQVFRRLKVLERQLDILLLLLLPIIIIIII
jgi:hypothetical protein